MYPENSAQAEMMVGAAMRAGFSGGLVVDFPHSARAKKYFLVLMVRSYSIRPLSLVYSYLMYAIPGLFMLNVCDPC